MSDVDLNDNILVFKEENELPKPKSQPWKILVVDDDDEVHLITQLVLRDFKVDNRSLTLISARNSQEAKDHLKRDDEIALVLLDVVMETEDAGLKLVQWIRDELKNNIVRIILRTGQPGVAPEKKIITEYEINDYKSKTEITDIKLFTSITVAIRGYRDLKIIHRSKEGFQQIVNATGSLFKIENLSIFFGSVLSQLTSILKIGEDTLYLHRDLNQEIENGETGYNIIAGTGTFAKIGSNSLDAIREHITLNDETLEIIDRGIAEEQSFFDTNYYLGFFTNGDQNKNIIVLRSKHPISVIDQEIIQVYISNVEIVFSNIQMSLSLKDTQREIIHTIGDIVETRSKETGNHVRRVGAISKILAAFLNLEPAQVELIETAASMHDVGKIGMPDSILNRPGPLEMAEMEIMKTHTTIGYQILKQGEIGGLQLAANIALTHHERWDGQGYPKGLKGTEIPIEGRIVAVADVYDVLCHARVHKEAWNSEKAAEFMLANSGTMFDPTIIDHFKTNLAEIDRVIEMYKEED